MVDEDLVGVLEVPWLHRAAEHFFEFARTVEDENPALAVAIDDVDVAVARDIAVGETQFTFILRESGLGDLHHHRAVEIAFDETVFIQHRSEDVFLALVLADYEAMQGGWHLENLQELAIGPINEEAAFFVVLDADVKIAGAVTGDFTVAITEFVLPGRWLDEIWHERVSWLGRSGNAQSDEGQ